MQVPLNVRNVVQADEFMLRQRGVGGQPVRPPGQQTTQDTQDTLQHRSPFCAKNRDLTFFAPHDTTLQVLGCKKRLDSNDVFKSPI